MLKTVDENYVVLHIAIVCASKRIVFLLLKVLAMGTLNLHVLAFQRGTGPPVISHNWRRS